MLLLLFQVSEGSFSADDDAYERYIREELAIAAPSDDLAPTATSTTLTTRLGPTFTLVP